MAETATLTDDQKIALKALGKDVDATPAKTQAELDAEKLLADQKIVDDKKKADDEAEALRLEAEKNKTQPIKSELTDEELMAEVAKRSGRKLASWDELKPTASEEDKKKALENRDADKVSFGLKKGLFNKNQFESFIIDSKNPTELVYSRELAEAKKDDPDWNEEKEKEFREEFDAEFGLNLDPSAAKRKRGERNIARIANTILKTDYGSIYSLDAEYDKYEGEVNSQKSQQQKILDTAPAYKADTESVLADFSSIEMDFEGEKLPVTISKEILQEVSDVMLDINFTSSQILKGYTKEGLKEFAKQYIRGQHFDALAFQAAKKYREKHEKGVRGIPTGGKIEIPGTGDENLSDDQKKALAAFKGQPQPVAN